MSPGSFLDLIVGTAAAVGRRQIRRSAPGVGWIAWTLFQARVSGVDQPATGNRVRLRQQNLSRHAHEVRIAVVAVAVRIGQLDRLDRRMQRVRRALAHGAKVESFENPQRLQEDWALVPESGLVDAIAAIGNRERLFDLAVIGREILFGHDAAGVA